MPLLISNFERLLEAVLTACQRHYGDRLISVAVYGSLGRGTPRPDSDADLLIVAEDLPEGRIARARDFQAVEAAVAPVLVELRAEGLAPELSPVFKTPREVGQGSPLFLDMVEDARILCDRDAFLASALRALRARLNRLGARRVWRGDAWFWDLKPDYRPGEVLEL